MSCMPLSFLKPDEQLVLEGPSSVTVVNGPTVAWYAPIVNSARKRKALQLEEQQYAKIKDTLTGTVEIVAGPTLHFMGAYDEHMATDSKIVLLNHQYARLVDAATGDVRVEKGEQTIVPGPYEHVTASVGTASNRQCANRLDSHIRVSTRSRQEDQRGVRRRRDGCAGAEQGDGPASCGWSRRRASSSRASTTRYRRCASSFALSRTRSPSPATMPASTTSTRAAARASTPRTARTRRARPSSSVRTGAGHDDVVVGHVARGSSE